MKRPTHSGFTLIELLIVVSVLAILGTVGLTIGHREWEREQVNAGIYELYGWLDMTRRSAMKGTSCLVTFNLSSNPTAPTELTAGNQLASSSCQPLGTVNLPGITRRSRFLASAVPQRISFTPQGTVVAATTPTPSPALLVTLMLEPNGPTRCLRLRDLLGFAEIGTADTGPSCPEASYSRVH